ncbi:hypothetical protein BJ138DRAFT_1143546 [Hygrophoropsis aurantiaca]|uniref:Uncharacterized protein n=1 Tax=Hygrophoropsis aurantiaca TaxID=72124 RepID=A0ACB8AN65_9AGAM|nr:hypothetical protein BJ138DRAFT_1143546 [Hygrophoropsis aurantiaca]
MHTIGQYVYRFHRKGVFVSPSSNGQENKVHEVAGYGIASVFTPAWNRRKGYASHMMSLLHWVLAPRTSEFNLGDFPQAWGQPPPEVKLAGDGYFSVLYSDVGAEFYNNSGPVGNKGGGWEVKEAISTVWQVPPLTETTVDVEGAWSWLKDSDLEQVWKEEVDFLKADLAKSAVSQTTVSFLTDEGVAAFQSTRALFGREDEVSMDIWGVRMDTLESPGDSKAPTATYATWSVDARPLPATLIVTRLRASDQTFPALLQKIQEAARKSGITRVETWNLPGDLQKIAAKWDGKTFERNEHLPAIRWYGKGATQDIVWAFNEKSVFDIATILLHIDQRTDILTFLDFE